MQPYLPYLIAFFAMAGYASLGSLTKKTGQLGLEGVPFILVNSASLAIMCLVVMFFLPKNDVFKTLPLEGWGWALLAAFINFIAFILYVWAVNRMPVVEYQTMFIASPVIAAFLGYLLLSENLELKHIIGGAIVALGVYIAIR